MASGKLVLMPFAGYATFDHCVRANADKDDPKAYCATIMRAVEKHLGPGPHPSGSDQDEHAGTNRSAQIDAEVARLKAFYRGINPDQFKETDDGLYLPCGRCDGEGGKSFWPGFTCFRCHGDRVDFVTHSQFRSRAGAGLRRREKMETEQAAREQARQDLILSGKPSPEQQAWEEWSTDKPDLAQRLASVWAKDKQVADELLFYIGRREKVYRSWEDLVTGAENAAWGLPSDGWRQITSKYSGTTRDGKKYKKGDLIMWAPKTWRGGDEIGGTYLPGDEPTVPPLSERDIPDTLEVVPDFPFRVAKHLGPGNHPSGSEQDRGGGNIKTKEERPALWNLISTWVAKHPGPDGSELHSTGTTQQEAHGTVRGFHGTEREDIGPIVHEGFDIAKNTTSLWGQGAYLAFDAGEAEAWMDYIGTDWTGEGFGVIGMTVDLKQLNVVRMFIQHSQRWDRPSDMAVFEDEEVGRRADIFFDDGIRGMGQAIRAAALELGYDAAEVIPTQDIDIGGSRWIRSGGHQLVIYSQEAFDRAVVDVEEVLPELIVSKRRLVTLYTLGRRKVRKHPGPGGSEVHKHLGPGNHPSGSSQDEHSGDYRGAHQPSATYGAPLHDLSLLVAPDIYTNPEYYFDMSAGYNRTAIHVARRLRNKPDASVTIYRAVPKDTATEINPGDWVTTARSYARLHGEANLANDFDILSRKVAAKELVWPGDAMAEYGWFPDFRPDEIEKRFIVHRILKHPKGADVHSTGTTQAVHGRKIGSAEVQAEARRVYGPAAEAEPAISADVVRFAEETGAELEGFIHRLKTPKSITNKIVRDMIEQKIGAKEAADGINDLNRYTAVFSRETYLDDVPRFTRMMADAGWEVIDHKLKNFWPAADSNPYDGYNTSWFHPSGAKVEVQFHTPESYVRKEELRGPYDTMRSAVVGSPTWKAAFAEAREVVSRWGRRHVPKGDWAALGILARGERAGLLERRLLERGL